MNNVEESLIVWMEDDKDGYDNYPALKTSQLRDLSIDGKFDLFDNLFYSLLHTKEKLLQTLNDCGYFTPDQIKEQKGIKITDKDAVCFQTDPYWQVTPLNSAQNISEYVKAGCPPTMVYVQLDKTSDLFKKIEAEKQKQQQEAKERKKKQLERKIKKAKKLLEKVEKTS